MIKSTINPSSNILLPRVKLKYHSNLQNNLGRLILQVCPQVKMCQCHRKPTTIFVPLPWLLVIFVHGGGYKGRPIDFWLPIKSKFFDAYLLLGESTCFILLAYALLCFHEMTSFGYSQCLLVCADGTRPFS